MTLLQPAEQASRPRRYRDFRVLKVLRTRDVTPQMRRVTLGGDEVAGFGKGPNVKLLVPPPGVTEPEWPMEGPDRKPVWPVPEKRPAVRTYSVRRHDPVAGEVDVDFVLHGTHGAASHWAMHARPGDLLGVGGPGGRTVGDASWYLLAGDHTALPAIARILENFPKEARGRAFIEIPDRHEEQPVRCHAQIEVTWLHRGALEAGRSNLLQDAVLGMAWPSGEKIFAWIGCESATVRRLRAYVRDERGLDRRQFLAIGYWRYGMDETAYHDKHNNDRDEDYYRTLLEERAASNS